MARAETELNAISPHQAMGEHESHEQAQEHSNHSEHVDHSGHEQVFRNRFPISRLLRAEVFAPAGMGMMSMWVAPVCWRCYSLIFHRSWLTSRIKPVLKVRALSI